MITSWREKERDTSPGRVLFVPRFWFLTRLHLTTRLEPGLGPSMVHIKSQVFLEPLHGLQEGILLGVLGDPVLGVPPDGEPVLDSAVKVDLVGESQVLQDGLGLVPLLGREDVVGLGGGDGQGTLEVSELVGLDERRVGRVTDVDLAGVGSEVTDDVFAAETISHGTDFLF